MTKELYRLSGIIFRSMQDMRSKIKEELEEDNITGDIGYIYGSQQRDGLRRMRMWCVCIESISMREKYFCTVV